MFWWSFTTSPLVQRQWTKVHISFTASQRGYLQVVGRRINDCSVHEIVESQHFSCWGKTLMIAERLKPHSLRVEILLFSNTHPRNCLWTILCFAFPLKEASKQPLFGSLLKPLLLWFYWKESMKNVGWKRDFQVSRQKFLPKCYISEAVNLWPWETRFTPPSLRHSFGLMNAHDMECFSDCCHVDRCCKEVSPIFVLQLFNACVAKWREGGECQQHHQDSHPQKPRAGRFVTKHPKLTSNFILEISNICH